MEHRWQMVWRGNVNARGKLRFVFGLCQDQVSSAFFFLALSTAVSNAFANNLEECRHNKFRHYFYSRPFRDAPSSVWRGTHLFYSSVKTFFPPR